MSTFFFLTQKDLTVKEKLNKKVVIFFCIEKQDFYHIVTSYKYMNFKLDINISRWFQMRCLNFVIQDEFFT